jgi:drug/metabolite transporter (DMT)-like permease
MHGEASTLDASVTRPKTATNQARGYLICILSTALLSTTAIFIRYLTTAYGLPPLVLAFWRDVFLVVALVVVFAAAFPRRFRVERSQLGFLALYGLVISLFNSLWTVSVVLNGAAVSTVLAYSSVAFTAVLGWWLLQERLGPLKGLAVALSLLGCVFVSGAYDVSAWQVNTPGIVAGVLTGLAYAGYTLMGRRAAQRGLNPWTTLLYSFGFALPFLLFYNLIPGWLPEGVASTQLLWLGSALGGWLVLIILGVGPTAGGFGLYTISLSYLPASVVNIIATLEPVMTATMAFLLLGERFTSPQWIGSALIIAGVVVLRLSEGNGEG